MSLIEHEVFQVEASHPALPGHFPGHPVVPGVVLLERVLARIGAASGWNQARLQLPVAKFLRPVLPETTLWLDVKADGRGGYAFSLSDEAGPVASGAVKPGAPE